MTEWLTAEDILERQEKIDMNKIVKHLCYDNPFYGFGDSFGDTLQEASDEELREALEWSYKNSGNKLRPKRIETELRFRAREEASKTDKRVIALLKKWDKEMALIRKKVHHG